MAYPRRVRGTDAVRGGATCGGHGAAGHRRGASVTGRTAVFLAVVAVLAFAVLLLGYTGRDDSHITYFVSQSLADGRGLINYNGDRVEQSSSLAFSLVLGAGAWLSGLSAATLGPVLSFVFLVLSLAVAAVIVRETSFSPLAVLGVVTMPSVYWSLSGMENSLYLLLFLMLCLGIVLSPDPGEDAPRARVLSPALIASTSAALALTRPEYILVIAFAVCLFTFAGWQDIRRHAALSVLIVGGAALGIAARLVAGLDLFPNTVYGKASDPELAADIRDGLDYLARTAREVPVSVLLAIFGFVAGLRFHATLAASAEKTAIKFLLAVAVAIGAFAVATGGDWMEAGRFVSVSVAVATFAGLASVAAGRVVLSVLFTILMLVDASRVATRAFGGLPFLRTYSYSAQAFQPSPLEARNVIHARDIGFIDRTLPVLRDAAETDGPLTVASIQAGMVAHYLALEMGEDFRFVDLFGLATRHVHPCRGEAGYGYDPYEDITALQACVGVEFDFIYDLDFGDWPRLEGLTAIGCREVFREEAVLDTLPPWKARLRAQQFLVDCR